MSEKLTLTPQEIVRQLDQNIVGQKAAKKAVAVAIRYRQLRQQVAPDLSREIMPRNILMIGSTGVGKTEIARRLADLVGAPFIKVEATKFTEVGYVGQDVEKIIRDLVDIAVRMCRIEAKKEVALAAKKAAEQTVVELIFSQKHQREDAVKSLTKAQKKKITEKIAKELAAGNINDECIDVEVNSNIAAVEIMAPPGMEEMSQQLESMFQSLNVDKPQVKAMCVKDALVFIADQEAEKRLNEEDVIQQALHMVAENGIVFLDEIDKIVMSPLHASHGSDVSREGVQRDLLPLIEGTTVHTKYGQVATDHILFIASGAFLEVKPADMASELQGRLPIRVQLESLSEQDFKKILVAPQFALTKQYQALLAVEQVDVQFTDEGLSKIAAIAYQINQESVDIGARRLHTVMEKLLEDVTFGAHRMKKSTLVIDANYVERKLKDLMKAENLQRWIL